MYSLGFALAACLGWGIADFIGGLKSRSLPTISVLIISNLSGTALLGLVLAATARPLIYTPDLLWAAPAGLAGFVAMFLLYRSLSLGTMSILAPISATGVILPVIWGILGGDELPGLKMAGMAAAFAGTLLAAMEPDRLSGQVQWTKGLPYALGAALLTGLYFIFMDAASQTDPHWACMIMRISTMVFLLAAIAVRRRKVAFRNRHLPYIALMGFLDAMASYAFALATNSGLLSLVAVVASLFPAVTVLLSTMILKERLNRAQLLGVVLAIVGVAMISAC